MDIESRIYNLKAAIILFFMINSFTPTIMARVCVLGTGGTIGGSGPDDNNYNEGEVSIGRILESAGIDPKEYTSRDILKIGSQNISDRELVKILIESDFEMKKNDCDSVLITHGSDTLTETAFFLKGLLSYEKYKKPLYLVAAMRPATSPNTDGSKNIIKAFTFIKKSSPGIYISMGDKIYSVPFVKKMHVNKLDAFKGYAFNNDINHLTEILPAPQTFKNNMFIEMLKEKYLKNEEIFPLIAKVSRQNYLQKDLIEFYLDKKVKGIIYEGVGNGEVNEKDIPYLNMAVNKGVTVVRSTHIEKGIVTEQDNFKKLIPSYYLRANQIQKILQWCHLLGINEPKKVIQEFSGVDNSQESVYHVYWESLN